MANHPVSSTTQQSWRRSRETLPVIEKTNNLNRTGVLLPKIGSDSFNNNGYSFESGLASNRAKPELPPKRDNKYNLKSTGGAGFSSGNTAADTSSYEPMSATKRTPRRTLGNIGNNDSKPKLSESIVKPPLYVPQQRRRKQEQYVSKTGFTSSISASKPEEGYVPSAITRQAKK